MDKLFWLLPRRLSALRKLVWLKLSGAASEIWRTITAAIATFTAVASPLRQLTVAVEPVQNLNGYDNPWPAGGGKNLFGGKALTQTVNTMECAITSDSALSISGTNSSANAAYFTIYPNTNGERYSMKAGTYVFSSKVAVPSGMTINFGFRDSDGNTIGISNIPLTSSQQSKSQTFAQDFEIFCNVQITGSANISYNGGVQIEAGSSPSTWTPYSNECLISGWSSLTVEQRGKNLYPASSIQGYAYSWYSHPNFADAVHPIFLKAGTTYVVSGERDPQYSNWFFLVRMFDTQGNNVDDVSKISGGIGTLGYIYVSGGKYFQPEGSGSAPLYQTITPAIDCYVDMVVQSNRGEATNAMVEIGSTPSATYVPYSPSSRSISISFGSTVYGGTLDVVNGKMTVDRAFAQLNDPDKWSSYVGTVNFRYDNNFSNRKMYSDSYTGLLCSYIGVVPNGDETARWVGASLGYFGIKSSALTLDQVKSDAAAGKISICYPLATPFELTLTPEQISTLQGTNNVWSDAGDVTVEYRVQ